MSYISLEANIGVGKSTLLPELAKVIGYNPIEEDLSKDGKFLTALGEYNKDKSKAINLQLTISEFRTEVAKKTMIGKHIVERSILSDLVFASVMNKRGDISNGDYKLYKSLAETNLKRYPPDMAIYLFCEPEISYERLRGRDREEESSVTLQYVTELEDTHIDMLPDLCEKYTIPLLTLDYTKFLTPESVANSINRFKEMIYVEQ